MPRHGHSRLRCVRGATPAPPKHRAEGFQMILLAAGIRLQIVCAEKSCRRARGSGLGFSRGEGAEGQGVGAAGSCPHAQAGWEVRIITRHPAHAERQRQGRVLLVYCKPPGACENHACCELSPGCGRAAGARGGARGFSSRWNHVIVGVAAAAMPFWVQIEAFCPFS